MNQLYFFLKNNVKCSVVHLDLSLTDNFPMAYNNKAISPVIVGIKNGIKMLDVRGDETWGSYENRHNIWTIKLMCFDIFTNKDIVCLFMSSYISCHY